MNSLNPLRPKRRLASLNECKIDLATELPIMFKAFQNAVTLYEKEITLTPPESRARAFEASLLNSKMIQSIQTFFPNNWKFGKYKRFLLNVQGYTVLFKKLNNKDMPMNITTSHSDAIMNQYQTSLFNNHSFSINPILFFGYKKDKFGNIQNPKLVYIDEDQVKWTIDNYFIKNLENAKTLNTSTTEKASPKLKQGSEKKTGTSK